MWFKTVNASKLFPTCWWLSFFFAIIVCRWQFKLFHIFTQFGVYYHYLKWHFIWHTDWHLNSKLLFRNENRWHQFSIARHRFFELVDDNWTRAIKLLRLDLVDFNVLQFRFKLWMFHRHTKLLVTFSTDADLKVYRTLTIKRFETSRLSSLGSYHSLSACDLFFDGGQYALRFSNNCKSLHWQPITTTTEKERRETMKLSCFFFVSDYWLRF